MRASVYEWMVSTKQGRVMVWLMRRSRGQRAAMLAAALIGNMGGGGVALLELLLIVTERGAGVVPLVGALALWSLASLGLLFAAFVSYAMGWTDAERRDALASSDLREGI